MGKENLIQLEQESVESLIEAGDKAAGQEMSDEESDQVKGGGRDWQSSICSLSYEMVKTCYPDYLERCFGKGSK